MNTKIRPLADRLVVIPDSAKDVTDNGIIIPDTAKEKPLRGTVSAVGTGKNGEPMTVKVGDVVMYSQHAGTEIRVNGQVQLIMSEEDVLLIIEN
jgi:chaperonin GroES